MVDQNTFMETLKSVADIMKVAETPMTKNEILSYFEDMELSKQQQTMILEYLLHSQNEDAEVENDTTKAELEGEGGKESKVFRMYLEEIKDLPTYERDEQVLLYKELLEGKESVIEEISSSWLTKVLESAKGYLTPKLNIEDLVQEGNLALFLALKQLCGKGYCEDVESVLVAAIEEGIMTYVSERNGETQAREAMLAKVSLVHAAKNMLRDESGEEPSLQKLAEYTKMTEEELADIFEFLEEENE